MTKVYSTSAYHAPDPVIPNKEFGKQIGFPLSRYYHLYDMECSPFDIILFSVNKVRHGWLDESPGTGKTFVHWYEVSRLAFQKEAAKKAAALGIPLTHQEIAAEDYPPAVMKAALSSLAWTKLSVYNTTDDKFVWYKNWDNEVNQPTDAPTLAIPPLPDDFFDQYGAGPADVYSKTFTTQVKPKSPYVWTISGGKLTRAA